MALINSVNHIHCTDVAITNMCSILSENVIFIIIAQWSLVLFWRCCWVNMKWMNYCNNRFMVNKVFKSAFMWDVRWDWRKVMSDQGHFFTPWHFILLFPYYMIHSWRLKLNFNFSTHIWCFKFRCVNFSLFILFTKC